jgi:hypothetical protein
LSHRPVEISVHDSVVANLTDGCQSKVVSIDVNDCLC